MIEPSIPSNEVERQKAVERYEILDSLPERSYDDITALMAEVCDAPISLIGLIDEDRHWLKSHHGLDFNESPRSLSFCGHAIASNQGIFTVEDAREDSRFADNPLVVEHGAIGYAGVPLIDEDGFALGALCVFDNKPMVLEDSQKQSLKSMARQVMYLLERHLRERRLEEAKQELDDKNEELKRFAGALTHDIQAPVANMVGLISLIEGDASEVLSKEVLEYLDYLKNSSVALRTYVDGLLAHYTSDNLLSSVPELFRIQDMFDSMDKLIVRDERTTLVFPEAAEEICSHRAALQQVLLNLIANAIKYGTGSHTQVDVGYKQDKTGFHFSVADNGSGIAPERQKSIFGLFETTDNIARDGSKGTGIGLATVSKLLDALGSSIALESTPGQGSTFSFTLPRVSSVKEPKLAA